MLDFLRRADFRTRLIFIALLVFLTIVLLAGGASRADALSQPIVRLSAILLIGISLYYFERDTFQSARLPITFLLLFAGYIALQLLPLPPAAWADLPGRAFYHEALQLADVKPVWRPLTFTPDLTINALLALLPAAAVVLASALLPIEAQRYTVVVILCGVLISVFLGVLQISGMGLYPYEITNRGSGVGLFANRNHQALLIACSLPLLTVWSSAREGLLPHRVRVLGSLLLTGLLVPLVLITGSRSGLVLTAISAVCAILLMLSSRRRRRQEGEWGVRLGALAAIAVGGAGVAATILLSRGTALQRLGATGTSELRFELAPVFFRMIGDFFPFGSGFGSFDSVYRRYEPEWSLSPFYLNHAHADWFQFVLEGGLVAALFMLVFLIWFAMKSVRVWRRKAWTSSDLLGKAATIIVIVLLAGSLGDYPLRTPALSVLFALSCYWLYVAAKGVDSRSPAQGGLAR